MPHAGPQRRNETSRRRRLKAYRHAAGVIQHAARPESMYASNDRPALLYVSIYRLKRGRRSASRIFLPRQYQRRIHLLL